MSDSFELFHVIADPASARVRKFVGDHDLLASFKFRNVGFDEHVVRLKARGGDGTFPALWDGTTLFVGADAIIERLSKRG